MLFAYSPRIEISAAAWLMRLRVATQSLGMVCFVFLSELENRAETVTNLREPASIDHAWLLRVVTMGSFSLVL
jgi:hypothetical protein